MFALLFGGPCDIFYIYIYTGWHIMKKPYVVFAVVAVLMFGIASAHSGGTDSKGGHYNRSTGEYHYHHGYSAHQHPNGVCPYEEPKSTPTRKPSTSFTYTNTKYSTKAPRTTQPPSDTNNEGDNDVVVFISGAGLGAAGLYHVLNKRRNK